MVDLEYKDEENEFIGSKEVKLEVMKDSWVLGGFMAI